MKSTAELLFFSDPFKNQLTCYARMKCELIRFSQAEQILAEPVAHSLKKF